MNLELKVIIDNILKGLFVFSIFRLHVPLASGYVVLYYLGILLVGLCFGLFMLWIDPARKARDTYRYM